MRPLILAGVAGSCVAAALTAQQLPAYHLIRRVPLPGAVRWDYLAVDSSRRRLFIAHDTEVLVLDADSATALGRIADTPGVHGIALAPEVGRGFTSNGGDASVTMFDLGSLRVLGRVHATGEEPDAIVYDSLTRRVFTLNGGSANATAFDAASGRAVGTIELGGTPEFAVVDGRGRLFVNLQDRDSVVSLDTRTLRPLSRWALPSCHQPTAMALNRQRRRLFIGCRNRLLAIVDADRGTVDATLPIGAGVDGVAFDPARQEALSANGDGTLTVIGTDRAGLYHVLATVPTAAGARTLALDPVTHRVFLVTAEFPPARPRQTANGGRPRPVPGTFTLLIYGI